VHILPHLILGCAKDSSNLSVLQQLGVTAVLNVSHNCPSLFQSQLQYMEIRVPDTYQADLLSRLDEAFQFIDGVKASGGRVLVHCHAGVSRSATVCMAYVMKTLNYDLRSAYDFVKSKRSCVSPNLHFMGQLLEFEKRLGVRSSSHPEANCLPCGLSCVEEEERERPCSLPPSWVSKEKRRAVSTPASLEISPYTVPSRKPLLSPRWTTPTNCSSLPSTPLPRYAAPLPCPQNHNSPPLHTRHIAHSCCSLQSLALTPITTVAAQNSPRPVPESL
jgi:protein-tyrosine phosphatase